MGSVCATAARGLLMCTIHIGYCYSTELEYAVYSGVHSAAFMVLYLLKVETEKYRKRHNGCFKEEPSCESVDIFVWTPVVIGTEGDVVGR